MKIGINLNKFRGYHNTLSGGFLNLKSIHFRLMKILINYKIFFFRCIYSQNGFVDYIDMFCRETFLLTN